MIQHRLLIAMYKHPLHLDDKVLTTPELQLGLQTFFVTIYLLVKGFLDPRQPTGGIIYQNFYLLLAQQLNFQGNYIITFYLIDSLCILYTRGCHTDTYCRVICDRGQSKSQRTSAHSAQILAAGLSTQTVCS